VVRRMIPVPLSKGEDGFVCEESTGCHRRCGEEFNVWEFAFGGVQRECQIATKSLCYTLHHRHDS
jgi:hypothetical protein